MPGRYDHDGFRQVTTALNGDHDMSCIYLDEAHYQYIANELVRLGASPAHYLLTDKRFWDAEYTLLRVNDWQAWNRTAYRERYADKVSDVASNEPIMECNPIGAVDLAQLLKALECIRYQCIDAKDFHGSDGEKILSELIRSVTSQIIALIPEYKNAKWTIE
jgi:hypothetical protein